MTAGRNQPPKPQRPRGFSENAGSQDEDIEVPDEVRRIWNTVARRWRRLGNDKDFLWDTLKLKYQLSEQYRLSGAQLRRVFTPSFPVPPADAAWISERMQAVTNPSLRRRLEGYIRYARRYGVVFVLDRKAVARDRPPFFRVLTSGFCGEKLHVRIRNNELNANSPRRWDGETPWADDFEDSKLQVPEWLASMMEEGCARYVEVEDDDEFSLVRQLLSVSYAPDTLTLVRYKGTPRVWLYLIGESLPLDKIWGNLGKAVTASRRELGRDRRGKRTDTPKLHGTLMNLIRARVPQKDLAVSRRRNEKEAGEKSRSDESYLSQLKRKLREPI